MRDSRDRNVSYFLHNFNLFYAGISDTMIGRYGSGKYFNMQMF